MYQGCLRYFLLLSILSAILADGPLLLAQKSKPVPNPGSSPTSATGSTAAQPSAQDQILDQLVTQFKQNDRSAQKAIVTSPTTYLYYLAARGTVVNPKAAVTQLVHDFQEQRVDVQVTTTQSAASATSTTNKGSVPWLFGFAVEHGGLTQSVVNNQIVLRGNIANAISAIKFHDYITSFNKIQEQNAIIRNIAKTSFALTFVPSQSTSSSTAALNQTNTFGGFSVHYDIWNHRDPRDPKWSARNCAAGTSTKTEADSRCVWVPVVQSLQLSSNQAAKFLDLFLKEPASKPGQPTPEAEWAALANAEFDKWSKTASDDGIKPMLTKLGDDLAERIKDSPDIIAAEQDTIAALIKVSDAKNKAYTKIMQSPTVSFEYDYTRQSASQIPSSTSTKMLSVKSPLPNLSTFNLIFNTYLLAGSQLSINGVATIFDSLPAGAKGGSMRDVQATAEVDIPLPEIASVGKPTLTFSGLYMDLINEPLGQHVLVNGVSESRTGNIGLFQGKFTIPAGKGSGVDIPLSFTYANRTELVKESDVRGAIGVTFNLDSIFSKPQ
ncbi:MAG: hypothetical protein ABSD98_17285 [Candidatus Korobacteraceae bacterium]|jgi:hypothetical protein